MRFFYSFILVFFFGFLANASEIYKNANRPISLNGTYTVGVGGDFAQLSDAAAAFNSAPISGPVILLLTDENYNESTNSIFNTNAGSSAENTLTIKPAVGKTIKMNFNAFSVVLNGVSHFMMDGSNDASDSRNLELRMKQFTIQSTESESCNNVSIKNTKIIGALLPPNGVSNILVTGPLPNHYFSAINNQFSTANYGIYINGNDQNPNLGCVVSMNNFSTLDTALILSNVTDFNVMENVFTGLHYVGITITKNTKDGNIFNNNIMGIGSSKYSVTGLNLQSLNPTANVKIYNNFFGRMSNFFEVKGIAISTGGGYKIYHNTVYFDDNLPITSRSYLVYILNTVPDHAVDLRNNILHNENTPNAAHYLVYSLAPKSVFSHIDHNIYHSAVKYGYINGVDVTSFDEFKIAFGGNENSVSGKPVYVSENDFHLPEESNPTIKALGTPIPEVTFDIDNQIRSSVRPDIGADEFTTFMNVENTDEFSFKYFPNPVVDFLTINSEAKIERVDILNYTGQLLFTQFTGSKVAKLDLREFSAGIYLLKLKIANQYKTVKIMKK